MKDITVFSQINKKDVNFLNVQMLGKNGISIQYKYLWIQQNILCWKPDYTKMY